jgi:hypothetical protein
LSRKGVNSISQCHVSPNPHGEQDWDEEIVKEDWDVEGDWNVEGDEYCEAVDCGEEFLDGEL